METKTLIVSVVLMSVFMAQIQVDAGICCPEPDARDAYNVCRSAGGSIPVCAAVGSCIIQSCPPGYPDDIVENTVVNEYCKLGCVSSVCGDLTTLQNSDESEIVNGAIEKCHNRCATICTGNSMNAVETA